MSISEDNPSVQNNGVERVSAECFNFYPKFNNQTEISQGRKKRLPIDWDVWDSILGTDCDAKVAKRIGCRERAVELRRKALSILPANRPNKIDWERWDDFLGAEPNEKIAAKIGCNVQAVEARRAKLGIRAFRTAPEVDLELLDALAGKLTDKEAARLAGCSVITVSRRRKKLGVSPYKKETNAQKTDKRASERIDWRSEEKNLGRVTDGELAKKLGCQDKTVAARRRKLGLEPFSKPKRIDWEIIDGHLGESPDEALAERFSCSTYAIKKRRAQLGIDAFEKHRAKSQEKLRAIHPPEIYDRPRLVFNGD
jgi:hypothetical protein